MPRKQVDVHLVLLEGMEKWFKVVCYLAIVNIAFDIIITLPPEIANRIFDAIFRKLGF